MMEKKTLYYDGACPLCRNEIKQLIKLADNNIALSARNIERVRSTTSDTLTTYEILWPDVLVFTTAGYEKFEERLNN